MALETSMLESLLADVMGEAERMERLRYRPNKRPAPRQWSEQMQLVLSMARQDDNALGFLKALYSMLKSGHYEADDIWQFRCLMHARPSAAMIPVMKSMRRCSAARTAETGVQKHPTRD